jgi:hypothetical protein
MTTYYSRCAALMLALVLAAPANAALEAYHVTDPAYRLALKGDLSDPIWQKAPLFDEFYENMPNDKIPAKFRTEVRVVYDSSNLYVGMKAFDPDPDAIRAPFSRRDKTLSDQDLLILYIDAIGSRKAAQFVRINPQGSVSDGSFTNQDYDDFAPDFPFDVATGRFDGGWSAEVRIPLSSIAYPAVRSAPWNLLVLRNMMRGERYLMASGPLPSETGCWLCFATPIDKLDDLPTGPSWSATPQLTLRSSKEPGAQRVASKVLSLDVKARPQAGLTFDGTLNPDFSQVEMDAPQLSGNTSFGLFTPEKRTFFLEGSDILRTPQRAIHTRTISDPAWGARVTRRSAGTDVTLLTVRDNGGGEVQLPGAYGSGVAPQDFASQASILRVNHGVGDVSLGAVASERSIVDGRGYNRMIGPDLVWQGGPDRRVEAQLLFSKTTAQPDGAGNLNQGPATSGHAGLASVTNETPHWYLSATASDISKGFRNDNGFMPQAGIRSYGSEVRRKLGHVGVMNLFNLYGTVERKYDSEGDLITDEARGGLFMFGPRGSVFDFQRRPAQRVRVREGGALLKRDAVYARVELNPGRQVAKVILEAELGEQVDVAAARVDRGGKAMASARIRASDRLEFEPSWSRAWINGRDGPEAGQTVYSAQALALNGIYHFSSRDTLRMMLQSTATRRHRQLPDYAAESDRSSGTGALVYSHVRGLGSVLYAGLTLSNARADAQQPLQQRNELFVKGSWQL